MMQLERNDYPSHIVMWSLMKQMLVRLQIPYRRLRTTIALPLRLRID